MPAEYAGFMYIIFMVIQYSNEFDWFPGQEKSKVFEIFPNVFKDNRGYFCEVLKDQCAWSSNGNFPLWLSNLGWIRQVNRSKSHGKTVRGCHAQKGQYCQGKLVQALTAKIYDIITDARPDSKTFGVSKAFVLDPEAQNQLWVPRGFLHSFITVSDEDSIFEYYCDNVFNKGSETGVSPMSLLPEVIKNLKCISGKDDMLQNDFKDLINAFDDPSKLNLSDKDSKAEDYLKWMNQTSKDYWDTGKRWYE